MGGYIEYLSIVVVIENVSENTGIDAITNFFPTEDAKNSDHFIWTYLFLNGQMEPCSRPVSSVLVCTCSERGRT
jgi:hypothetical protein